MSPPVSGGKGEGKKDVVTAPSSSGTAPPDKLDLFSWAESTAEIERILTRTGQEIARLERIVNRARRGGPDE